MSGVYERRSGLHASIGSASTHTQTHPHGRASANRGSWQTITRSHQPEPSESIALSLQTPNVLPQTRNFTPSLPTGANAASFNVLRKSTITAAKLFSEKSGSQMGEGFFCCCCCAVQQPWSCLWRCW